MKKIALLLSTLCFSLGAYATATHNTSNHGAAHVVNETETGAKKIVEGAGDVLEDAAEDVGKVVTGVGKAAENTLTDIKNGTERVLKNNTNSPKQH